MKRDCRSISPGPKLAVVTLSPEGAVIAASLKKGLGDADIFLHRGVAWTEEVKRFERIVTLTRKIFNRYQGIIFIAPCGIVVRALSDLASDKKKDPAVVVVDAGGRFTVSLLSGHEGGANDLAVSVGNIIGAEPVITTTTEAVKTVIVGIGCRRGTSADAIVRSITESLRKCEIDYSQVRFLASADIKSDEQGLLLASKTLGIPIRFIKADEIRSSRRGFTRSAFVEKKVGLPAVAEPAALLAGRRTSLILPKTIIRGVTVALARENCLWSE